MAVIVTHNKIATLPDEPGAEVNKAEWNDAHAIVGLGSAAEAATTDFDTAGAAAAVAAAAVMDGDAAGGDLAGTYPDPTVTQARGLREPTGPTTLVMGAVADGQVLTRSGSTIIGTTPGAGSTNIKQTEVDFGTTPVAEATFTITDVDVLASSQIIASLAYEAPTDKDLDELELDQFSFACAPGAGAFDLFMKPIDGGYVADKFKVNYLIG